MEDLSSDFGRWSRPKLVRQLRTACLDVCYERASGDYLFHAASDGRMVRVLDLSSGHGAALFGHNHPLLVDTLKKALDAQRPANVPQSVRGPAGELARRLSDLVGRGSGRSYVVTLFDSAMEVRHAALAHAELEWSMRRDIAVERCRSALDRLGRSSHAFEHRDDIARAQRSLEELESARPIGLVSKPAGNPGTRAATTDPPPHPSPWKHRAAVIPLPQGDVATLHDAVRSARLTVDDAVAGADGVFRLVSRPFSTILGCFVDPMQSDAGGHYLDADFARELGTLAETDGFPLVLDETESGMGRTGSFLAADELGLHGNYVLLAKGLGGGLTKLAALLVDRRRYVDDFDFIGTVSLADDDFSCEVGLRALSLLEADGSALLESSRSKSEFLLERLAELANRHPALLRVRGRGLLFDLEFRDLPTPSSESSKILCDQELLTLFLAGYYLRKHQIRVLPAESCPATLRLAPSAFVSLNELERFVDATARLLELLQRGDATELLDFVVRASRSEEAA